MARLREQQQERAARERLSGNLLGILQIRTVTAQR